MTNLPTTDTAAATLKETNLLAKAAQFSFRARMDKKTNEGPVFERGLARGIFDPGELASSGVDGDEGIQAGLFGLA